MKRLIVICMLLAASVAWGAECETITVADTAIGFTTAKYQIPAGFARVEAYCCLETAQVRVRYDGTSPTSLVGIVMNVNDCVLISNRWDMANVKFIRTGASSGSLTCCYSFWR